MATKNLFQKAKENGKTKQKDSGHIIVKISGKEFDENLKKFAELSIKIKEIETELSLAQGTVKEISINQFYKLYNKNKVNPGSIVIVSDSGAQFMLTPTDNYIKINEDRSNELKEKYSDDVVTEKTEFTFNPVLLDKYAEILSDLIANCDDISDEDKDNLILSKTVYSVAKGSINKAALMGEVDEYLSDIQPIFQMKNAKMSE